MIRRLRLYFGFFTGCLWFDHIYVGYTCHWCGHVTEVFHD